MRWALLYLHTQVSQKLMGSKKGYSMAYMQTWHGQ
jgi:hypothetical protein